MPEGTFVTFKNEIATAAGGNGGATGQSTGETGKSTTEEGEDKKEKKDKKGLLGNVGKMLTGVLGIQVSFAAMLRQSQIATGFLGAVFQVLGAILDSFLLAFAPQLFAIVEHLARLIPIARGIGEEVALQVGNLWEHIKTFTAWLKPIILAIWEVLKGIFDWFSELAPIWKWTLAAVYAIPRLLAFMRAGFFVNMGKVMFLQIGKALAYHRVKTAATGGKGGGAMGLAMMIPHARIIALIAVVAGMFFTLGFANKDKGKGEAATLDVSGQLGKRYLPSQASQLGGSLNESMSAITKPFTDQVTPVFIGAAEEMKQAVTVASAKMTDDWAGMGLKFDEYGIGVASMDAMNGRIVGASGIVVEDFGKIASASGLLLDEYYLTINAMDSQRAGYDKNLEEDIEATKLRQKGIKDATDGWVGDITEATGLQIGGYGTLLNGTDSAAAALERQAKAIDEGNTNWKVGSEQSKNQWASTASYIHDGVVKANDTVVNIIAKGEMERAMGNMSGAFNNTADYFLAMLNQDDKDLKEAAIKQKEATIAFQAMTQTVMNGYTQDRADAKAQRESLGTYLLGSENPALAYLSNEY